MDEYKEYLYMRNEEAFNAADPGDLTIAQDLRKRLQCKSFKWFMESVAFDLPKYFPLIDPPDFASGAIRSLSNQKLCIDSLGRSDFEEVGIAKCSPNIKNPNSSQFWRLSWYRDIRQKYETVCLDAVKKSKANSQIQIIECHGLQGNQCWKYIVDKKWIKTGTGEYCMELDAKNLKVYVNKCNETNENMKWEWGFLNLTSYTKKNYQQKK